MTDRPENGSVRRSPTRNAVLLIASDELGRGSPELGRILLRSFLKTAAQVEPKPRRVVFLNAGVKLTTEGSDLLSDLQTLEQAGVELLSCGTCLDYFSLKEKLRAGRVSNMHEIVTSLMTADLVIRP